jgi:hypothetical protein
MKSRRNAVARLLAISSPAIGVGPQTEFPEAGKHSQDLAALLQGRNGFYAFESALHVFPSGSSTEPTLEQWNGDALWRDAYGDLADGLFSFAEDVFGGQFTLSDRGVGAFDPETGDVTIIAKDIPSWAAAILREPETLSGCPLARQWQRLHGPLAAGRRLAPKTPFILGGPFEVENLASIDTVESLRFRAHLATQIRDVPDGSKISFRIE